MFERSFRNQPQLTPVQGLPSYSGDRRRYRMGSRFTYVPFDKCRSIEPCSENVGWLANRPVVMDNAGWRYLDTGEIAMVTGVMPSKNGSLRRANFLERFVNRHFAPKG